MRKSNNCTLCFRSPDVISILQSLGLGQTSVDWLKGSKYLNLAVAYLLYEIFKIPRYAVTLYGTRKAVLHYTKIGKMPKVAAKNKMKNLSKESANLAKEKMKDPQLVEKTVRRTKEGANKIRNSRQVARLQSGIKNNKRLTAFRSSMRTRFRRQNIFLKARQLDDVMVRKMNKARAHPRFRKLVSKVNSNKHVKRLKDHPNTKKAVSTGKSTINKGIKKGRDYINEQNKKK